MPEKKAWGLLYFGSPDKLERRNKLFITLVKVGAALLAYYIFVRITGLSIPCIFHEVTGLKCPGCGLTHMCLHLAKLELAEAFKSNALLFVLLPPAVLLTAVKLLFMPDWLEINSRVYKVGEMILLTAIVIFGAVRNFVGL